MHHLLSEITVSKYVVGRSALLKYFNGILNNQLENHSGIAFLKLKCFRLTRKSYTKQILAVMLTDSDWWGVCVCEWGE